MYMEIQVVSIIFIKMNKEYDKYTKNIQYNYTYDFREIDVENEEILKKLFSHKNFRSFEKTKYRNFDEWFAYSQFE